MAQAIDHCRKEWQVDVIVIPSGFAKNYRCVSKALTEAGAANIVVVAAAGNHGNLDDVVFPGRLYTANKLLCMFATNALISLSPMWNPRVAAGQGIKGCYAILGENICLQTDTDSDNCQGCKGLLLSGTSYSTVIGAGVAAHLLDFSGQPECRNSIEERDSLTSVEGMASVFSSMCHSSNDEVPCMRPWMLLPKGVQGEFGEDMWTFRQRARKRICETISTALEKRY